MVNRESLYLFKLETRLETVARYNQKALYGLKSSKSLYMDFHVGSPSRLSLCPLHVGFLDYIDYPCRL